MQIFKMFAKISKIRDMYKIYEIKKCIQKNKWICFLCKDPYYIL